MLGDDASWKALPQIARVQLRDYHATGMLPRYAERPLRSVRSFSTTSRDQIWIVQNFFDDCFAHNRCSFSLNEFRYIYEASAGLSSHCLAPRTKLSNLSPTKLFLKCYCVTIDPNNSNRHFGNHRTLKACLAYCLAHLFKTKASQMLLVIQICNSMQV